MQMLWVLILGLAYTVSARDCMMGIGMNNLEMNKMAGNWHVMAMKASSTAEEDKVKKMKCVDVNYTPQGNDMKVKAMYNEDGEHKEMNGMYKHKDGQNAMFQKDFPDHQEYNNFMVQIVCSDYNTWALMYSCDQHGAGDSTEHMVMMGRDRSKYEDMKNNHEMMQCMQDKMHMTMDKMMNMNEGCH